MTLNETFTRRLRLARVNAGNIADVGTVQLYRWSDPKKNMPGSYSLWRICTALDVDADWLTGYSNTPHRVMDTADAPRIAERVELLLADRGLSNDAAAKLCGVPASAMRQWRRGNTAPNMASLIRLCEGLETTPNYILGLVPGDKITF